MAPRSARPEHNRTSGVEVADSTVVATTLGTAAITGGLGYLAAHLQGRSAREALYAEDRRLERQERDAHRQKRQVAYQEFLSSVFSFPLLAKGYRDVDQTVFHEWYERFQSHSHAVMLLGSEPVVRATDKLDGILLLVLEAFKDDRQSSIQERLERALKPRDKELHEAYVELQEAMRTDVSPLAAPGEVDRST